MAGRAQTLRGRWMAPVTVLCGVAASILAFAVSDGSVRHADSLLLRQEATQGSLLVGQLYGRPPAAVGALAGLVGPDGAPGAGWRAQAGLVALANHYDALLLLRQRAGHLRVLAGVGSAHRAFGDGGNAAARAALGRGAGDAWEVATRSGRRWLGEFVGPPAAPPGDVAYVEQALPTRPISLDVLPGHPFSGVQAALYAGSEAPGHLVLATTTHVPFTGLRATTVVATGTVAAADPVTLGTRPAPSPPAGSIVLVVRPTGPLVGAAAAAEPWVLLGGGLAATVVVGALLLVADRRRRNAERLAGALRHQAYHDSLTGLGNRLFFADRLGAAVAGMAGGGGSVGVLLLDLDNFKAVNEQRGHTAGDELLRAVGDRLSASVRPGDTVARLGGDEFAVLAEGDPATTAADAERLLDAFRAPVAVQQGPVEARVSIGVVTTSDPRATAGELLRDADIAMYAAKSGGKGRLEVFRPELRDRVVELLELESDLARAVERGEIVVHYQAVVDLRTNRPTGVEALVRWERPGRGMVSPADFIPVAERSGAIVPLGRWLLRRACDDLRTLQRRTARADLGVSVNVSTHQLEDPEFVADVAGALRRSGLHPGALTLEVTESVFMADPERCAALLRRLKQLGVHLSIDDFGTGYSSLGYLQHLPLDELKIDRSFVVAGDGTRPPPLVHSIVRMADDLGLATVAEGVETDVQLDHMRAAGCGSAQGYLFSRPMDLDGLVADAVFAGSRATLPERTRRSPLN